MYFWEIYNFLAERKFYIDNIKDFYEITSFEQNPQLAYTHYDTFNNIFYMWDNEGHYYTFRIHPSLIPINSVKKIKRLQK